jgi:hypothetical protein
MHLPVPQAHTTPGSPAPLAVSGKPSTAVRPLPVLSVGLHRRTLFVLVCFATITWRSLVMPADPDVFIHLAAGRWIVEHGRIPYTDPFTSASQGRPWIDHEWLPQVLMYLLYQTAGYRALTLLFTAVILAACWIAYRSLRRRGVHEVVAAAVVAWAAILSSPLWGVRIQMLTFALASVYLAALLDYAEGRRRQLWLFVPLSLLWANLHGGFIVGLLLLGLFAAGTLGQALWLLLRRQTAPTQTQDARALLGRFAHLAAVGAACTAISLVNPNGLAMLLYPITHYGGTANPSMKYIAEWQSPNFHEPLFLVFAAALAALAIVPPPRPTAPDEGRSSASWPLNLCLVVLTMMALQSARHLPLFALAFAAVTGPRLDVLAGGWLRRERLPESPLFARLNLALLVGIIGLLLTQPLTHEGLQLGREPRLNPYPAGGVEHLLRTRPPGNLFNTYHWGGFLMLRLYPVQQPFIDGRADVHGPEVMDEYMRVTTLQAGWRETLRRYGINTVLIEKDSALAAALAEDPDWLRTYRGEVEEVFVRRSILPPPGGPE